jgi:hypothetical protein
MSKEQDNKAIVGRWFQDFWGNPWNPNVIEGKTGEFHERRIFHQ